MLGYEGPRGRPDVPGFLGPVPKACGVDQLLWVTRACVPGCTGSAKYPGRHGLGSEFLRGRPAVQEISHPGPRGGSVEPNLGSTRALFRVPAESTHCPSNSGLDLRASGVEHLSRATRLGSDGPQVRPSFPVIHARLCGPGVSTSCPGRLGPVTEGWRGGPSLPGDSGPCPRSRGVNQLYRASRDLIRGPVGLARSPGGLEIRSDGFGVNEMYRTTRARVRMPAVLTTWPRATCGPLRAPAVSNSSHG